MVDDFDNAAVRRTQLRFQAKQQQLLSDYNTHKANGDEFGADETIDRLNALEAEAAAFQRNQQRYQQQPQQVPLTDAEVQALSPERLSQHPEAIDRIFSKSKYYTPGQWSEPEIARRVKQGWDEVQRRRRDERLRGQ